MTIAPEEIKACCAAAYSTEAARFLLGDSFHPGGGALTSQLIAALGVGAGATLVDVASGRGTSTLQVARETGAAVIGVELSPTNVAAANAAAREARLDDRVRFLHGDAEALPLADASMDGALCECALCTFPDKDAAAHELARVLRSGARLALSDVTAEPAQLPRELTDLRGWIACIADARPLRELAILLGRADSSSRRSSNATTHSKRSSSASITACARPRCLALSTPMRSPAGPSSSTQRAPRSAANPWATGS